MEILREFNFLSVCCRLALALLCGAIIGYGRTRKNRTAGFRTYMMICVASALTILTSLYELEMQNTLWAPVVQAVGSKFDVSRLAAQVISGAGFLAAGSIIMVDHQQVEGLTTATGLFASVCMGIACGAGFYECVLISFVLIGLVLNVMTPLENLFKRRTRNIDLYVEFQSLEDIQTITEKIESRSASIHDIDVERLKKEGDRYPSAVFSLRLSKDRMSHSDMRATLAELPCVYSVQEIIA